MEGNEFFDLGYALWNYHFEQERQNNLLNIHNVRKKHFSKLIAQINANYKRLEEYIFKTKIIPPLNYYQGQDCKRDVLHILAYIAYATTQPHFFALPQTFSKVLAPLETDVVGATIRIQGVVNELMEHEHLVFRKNDDDGLELSEKCKSLVCKNNLSAFGLSKEAVEKTLAKKRARDKKPEPSKDTLLPSFSAKTIEHRLQEFVIGNEGVVRNLSCRLAIHLQKAKMILRGEPVTAPNEVIFLIGSSGAGKSHCISSIQKALAEKDRHNIPFASVSGADCTEVGYVGLDASEILCKGLVASAHGDIALAQTGIAWIDEIDKRAFKSSASNSTDISSGFQYACLRLFEGSEQILNEKKYSRADPIIFNTYGTMFICSGAFESLNYYIQKRLKKGIGFNITGNDTRNSQVLIEALCDYGMSRQLISRGTSLIILKDPSISELLRILDFNRGIISSYNQVLNQSNMSISLSRESKLVIAKYGYHSKSFARGMKRIVSRLIEDVMYSGIQGKTEIQASDVRAVIDEADANILEHKPENIITSSVDIEEPISAYGS